MIQLKKYAGIIALVVITSTSSFSQKIDVNNVTDSQLEKGLQEARRRGLSLDQIERIAKQKGYSSAEIKKLRSRLGTYKTDEVDFEGIQSEDLNGLRREFGGELIDDIIGRSDSLRERFDDTENGHVIFGSYLFENEEISFEPSINVPTPKNYIIGPEDEINIDIWGAAEQVFNLLVTPEGYIRIPDLGPVFVNGKTIEEARNIIRQKLRKIYSGISVNNSKGNTFTQISLGNIRGIKVNVIGEVEYPGTYTLSSLSNVLHALQASGGPNKKGSYRKIDIFRNNKKISSFDIYDFLIKGSNGGDLILKSQDVILVHPYNRRIVAVGELKREGLFEMLDDETFGDLLKFSGGFSEFAYRRLVNIFRTEQDSKSIVTVKAIEFDSIELQSGDSINIERASGRFKNKVSIGGGGIMRPGSYEFKQGMKISSLLDLADGLKDDVFLQRGLLVRVNKDRTYESLDFSVSDILEGKGDILLQNEDSLAIRSISEVKDKYVIKIQGAVREPGVFSYARGMTIESLIFLAGGLKDKAHKTDMLITRRLNSSNNNDLGRLTEVFSIEFDPTMGLNDKSFKLEPYDEVFVKISPFYHKQINVRVEGEVLFPGIYSILDKEERISDVVNRAGGTTQFAHIRGATLIRRTEYFEEDDQSEIGDTNIKNDIRREYLQTLEKQDPNKKGLVLDNEFENVGINFEKAMEYPGSKYDLVLKEGDIVSVPSQSNTVRIRGKANFPSTTVYEEGKRMGYFIRKSGGFNDLSHKRNSFIVYSNGRAKGVKSIFGVKFYPKVEPGSDIVVAGRSRKEKFDWGTFTSIISSLVLITVTIDRISTTN